jgi:hypothetical protein
MPPSGHRYRHQDCFSKITATITASRNIVNSSNPVLKGEFLMSVAVSSQITKSADPAINQSLFVFRKEGRGISRATILFARWLIVPMGQREHQKRAHRNDPKIIIGHPTAQLKSPPKFVFGSAGPRKSRIRRMKKNGAAAL